MHPTFVAGVRVPPQRITERCALGLKAIPKILSVPLGGRFDFEHLRRALATLRKNGQQYKATFTVQEAAFSFVTYLYTCYKTWSRFLPCPMCAGRGPRAQDASRWGHRFRERLVPCPPPDAAGAHGAARRRADSGQVQGCLCDFVNNVFGCSILCESVILHFIWHLFLRWSNEAATPMDQALVASERAVRELRRADLHVGKLFYLSDGDALLYPEDPTLYTSL